MTQMLHCILNLFYNVALKYEITIAFISNVAQALTDYLFTVLKEQLEDKREYVTAF